jgi:hypothetical protein
MVGGQDQGPKEAMSEMFKKDPLESLVREAIQNSLDAVRDKSMPVHVVFRWKRLSGKNYPGLFALREHMQDCVDFWGSNSSSKEKFDPMIRFIQENAIGGVYYLEVSDSNTTGMDYKPNDRACPFYSFVRSAGNSSKATVGAGGSYGFGKAAYFNVSRIRTVLVSTQTPDKDFFFEGISSLCTHEHEGKKRTHVGYYDNNDGQPISGEDNIPKRFRRDEPGTSVFIVGVERNEGYEEIVKAVLLHFWLSVLEGKLTVSLIRSREGELNLGEDALEINRDSLDGFIETFFPDTHDKKRGHANPRPYYEAVKLADTDKRHIFIKQYLSHLGSVRFYINRVKQATDRISYMRSPRMLVYNKPNNSGYQFYGVFICDDEKGNEILRHTEDPSHSEWDWKNCGGNRKYECKDALDEMRSFIDQTLVRIFSSNGATFLNIAGLDEFLFIPTSDEDDDNFDTEASAGIPSGEVQEEGTSSTTQLSDPKPFSAKAPEEKTSTGHVLVNYRATAENAELGELYSGHTTKPLKRSGGGEPSSKLPSTPHQENEERGKVGNYAYPIQVSYRSFAQVENNKVYHVIIIHSGIEVEDGQVVIFTGGEQDDERIPVVESSIGSVIDNTVYGLKLHVGKNTLKVRLADDMKHAIKLEAYENK